MTHETLVRNIEALSFNDLTESEKLDYSDMEKYMQEAASFIRHGSLTFCLDPTWELTYSETLGRMVYPMTYDSGFTFLRNEQGHWDIGYYPGD